MFGMTAMSTAVAPLQGSPTFLSLLGTLSNPLLGMLVGAVFTAVIQSSAAAVGILQHGYVFNDLLTDYERVGDHCSNVAVAMIELAHNVFDTHEYLDSMKSLKSAAFEENYEVFRARYFL